VLRLAAGVEDRAVLKITPEQIDEFSRRLDEAGVAHDFHVYPGAPHSFFDRKQDEYAEVSEDAWRRVLAFVAER
jgi:carboxymethylenebutenolidase